ncbi:MAG: alanine--tRNA ligase-related protein [Lachnospiraceae bacterium]|nr:alanine--tRNA ligase-related protein [Lachnospiraceae bacterium]
MFTKKLFYTNAYQTTCTASVLECRSSKNGFAIILDQTVFYPEGGGQPGDIGFLNEIPVKDTREEGGLILHYTEQPMEPGTAVTASINWDYRFDLMQQHSGEHMISGVIHRRWGYDNVGFHMGADVITIDLSGELTMAELAGVEEEVNQAIWKNDPVKIWVPSEDALPSIPYRSKKELTGEVRIVEFPEIDICACCGMHVDRTGAIGLVKILNCEKFRSGVRVELLCGKRALQYLSSVNEQNRAVSRLLSAKPLETAKAVQLVQAEVNEKRQRIYAMEESIFQAKAKELEDVGDVVVFLDDFSADGVRRACDLIQHSCGGRAAVFSGTDETGYKYAIGLPGGDLRSFVKEFNLALNGRGGGKPFFVQGSVQASRSAIREYLLKNS